MLQLLSVSLPDGVVPGLGAPELGGGPQEGFLWKKFTKCWRAQDWIDWLGALPDFYGPADGECRVLRSTT